jgi:epoxyqueuosine reductase QueG
MRDDETILTPCTGNPGSGHAADDPVPLEAEWLKRLAREAGADDVGLVDAGRPELAGAQEALRAYLPATRTLVSLVCRVQRANARATARSLYNIEQRRCTEQLEQSARKFAAALEGEGVGAVYLPMAFPMDFDARLWVSHKTVAQVAGLGAMGLNRLLLHPAFGSCILITTVLLDRAATAYDQPLAANPCIGCKLCVAACPTGAVCADGTFKGELCAAHNYRFRLQGFLHWVNTLADAKTSEEYRSTYSDAETLNLWQGLTYEASNLCGYCVAVCPAGKRTVDAYEKDRAGYVAEVVKPLRERSEGVYAHPGSDSDGYAERHFKNKSTRRIPAALGT